MATFPSAACLQIKIGYNGDIRSFRMPSSHPYQALQQFVKTSYQIYDFLLQYMDEDGDKLTIASDRGLSDALQTCLKQSLRSLRIMVTTKPSASSSSPPSTTADDADAIEFHWGSACHQCRMSPIQGVRYKCCVCSNFDLCARCEALPSHTPQHDPSHPWLKLYAHKHTLSRFGVSAHAHTFVGLNEALSNLGLSVHVATATTTTTTVTPPPPPRDAARNGRSRALTAEFVEHASLPAGTACVLDGVESKKWRVRNTSETEWGSHVELVFLDGDARLVLHRRVAVQHCGAGQVVEVCAQLRIPSTAGRYRARFRLAEGAQAFGPILTAELVAVQSTNTEVETKTTTNGYGNGQQSSGRRRLSMVLSKHVPSVACGVCGDYLMMRMTRQQQQQEATAVSCALCHGRCASSEETSYECAKHSYRLCAVCHQQQLMRAIGDDAGPLQKVSPVHVHAQPTRDDVRRMSELRRTFPRFYFLSDAEMLSSVLATGSPAHMQAVVCRLFDGVSSLLLDDDDDAHACIVLGLRARNGEELRFRRCINASKHGNEACVWLRKLEYQMRYSLSMALEESFGEYKVLESSDAYFAWISHYPSQILLLTKRCLWCKTIEFFLGGQQGMDLSEVERELSAEIRLLAAHVSRLIDDMHAEELEEQEEQDEAAATAFGIVRHKIGALIQQLIYQRDVTRQLIRQKVRSVESSVWSSQMRTYYRSDDNMLDEHSIFKKLLLKCSGRVYFYGYEFYGDIASFIYSRSTHTDKLFPRLLRACVDGGQLANVFGAVGTGKREAIQVFAYDLGRPCKVWSADQAARVRVRQWFAGVAAMGGFGVLTADDLHAGAEEAIDCVAAIHGHGDGHHDRKIHVHENARLFVVSRHAISDDSSSSSKLKQLYARTRSFAMAAENKISITHTLLAMHGFSSAEHLAPKMAMLLDLCGELLTGKRYDLSFKLIMQIADKAGAALLAHIIAHKLESGQEDVDAVGVDEEEDDMDDDALNMTATGKHEHQNTEKQQRQEGRLLIDALVAIVFAQLTPNDRVLFESLVESAFPEMNMEWHRFSESTQHAQQAKQRRLSQSIVDAAHTSQAEQTMTQKTKKFKYETQLQHLMMMGFNDVAQIKEALTKHRGNRENAMNELFSLII